jgi:hypothetical protein
MANPDTLNRGHPPGSTLKPLVKLPKDPADCWEWLGIVCPTTGYGQKQWHGRKYAAHRWLWMQLFGPIPDRVPMHNLCGNKACVSPHHWTLSSQSEINRASIQSVLTAGDAAEIKRVPKAQRATKAQRAAIAHVFAHRFGCSRQLIYDIWAGRAWKSVTTKPSPSCRVTLPHPEAPHAEAANTG